MNLHLTMTGRIDDCVQLTYRTPSETVRDLLPDGLELVTRGPWAFWNVMACRVERLRLAGLPALSGISYRHISYRLFVQAMTDRAEVVRGLYFMRSDVDARSLCAVGNGLTDLRLHPSPITLDADDCGVRCRVDGGAGAVLDLAHAPASLAPGSCFPTTEDARTFCRYTPNGLAVFEHGGARRLRITRVSRGQSVWSETPLAVRDAKLGYFDSIGQAEQVNLEWACRLGAMDYRWRIGETAGLLSQPTNVQVLPHAAGVG